MLERVKNRGINGELWKAEFWKTLGIIGKTKLWENRDFYIEQRIVGENREL